MIGIVLRLVSFAVGALALCAITGVPSLKTLRLDTSNMLQPRVTLIFSGGVPSYQTIANGAKDVTLHLDRTTRQSSVPSSLSLDGFVRDVTIGATKDGLDLTVHGKVPLLLDINQNSEESIEVTVSPARRSRSESASLPQPILPVALDRSKSMEVVPLQYADVSEVVGLLAPGIQIASNDNFSPQQQNFGSPSISSGSLGLPISSTQPQQLGSLFSGGVSSAPSLGQQVTANIGVDRRLNAIVLRGTPAEIAELKQEIAKIDVPLSSVVLETEVVELDDSSARNLGIDFTSGNGQVAAVTYQAKSQASAQGSATLQAAVYAEVSKGHGKLLARPSIVAQNGTSAQIITGQALPIVTSIAVSGVNAVSQQVQYVNVGVSLQIEPRITSDGYVTSHVYAQVSSVTGSQQGYPTLSQRSATTSATVLDGQSYIIGGLYQEDDIRSLGKTPGFGDLPLIGGLFRVRNDTYALTSLYIIVTPHIIRNRSNEPDTATKSLSSPG